MNVTLKAPWLVFDLGAPHRVISWAVANPGLTDANRILWREVRNADLPEGFDATAWLARELAARGESDAVAMLTSRSLAAYRTASVMVDGIRADCVVTAGLSNAERIGTRLPPADVDSGAGWGTINIGLRLSCGLGDAALIEAVSISAEARTAAIMETGPMLATGQATGTGTDCIAIAAPAGTGRHVGLHTAAGEALGRATHDAVRAATLTWMEAAGRHQRMP